MVNLSSRDPGQLARFDATGAVSPDVPSYAVNTGQAASALAEVAGSLSGTLGKLADQAAQREGQMAGLTAGQQSGAAYLQAQDAALTSAGAAGRGPWMEQAKALLRHEEGFIDKAKMDVNAHRVGYGSDTYVAADGTVHPVTPGTAITRDDAERDLTYRLTQREGLKAQQQLGDVWDKLPDGVKAPLASVAYNYGSLPSEVVAAAKTGDIQAIASAVGGLSSNKARRGREAAMIMANAGLPSADPSGATTPPSSDPSAGPAGTPSGLVAPGNIDLAKRPLVKNADGSTSTVRSMSFEEDGKEVLVPTVSPDGKILDNNAAIALYRKTGQHLGKFDNADDATAYAEKLHASQAQFYGLDKSSTGSTHVVQPLSTEPLALRRDGTIRGEAYDDAALSAWGWRMQQGVSTELFAAQQEHQDDPAGFAGAADQIRKKYSAELQDPQQQEMFDKTFAQNTEAYGKNIVANHEKKLREDQLSSYAGGIAARQIDLERQAQVLGANPDGDRIVGDQVKTMQASIDGAVAQGILTPLQGQKQKQDIAETAARGRIQGVYDALPTPDQKEQFALGVLDDWKSKKGPLAALPYDTVKGISDTLRRDAREKINANSAKDKVEIARVSGLIDDDVASMAASGKGIDPNQTGLTPDHVKAMVGEAGMIKWQQARDHAGKLYDATSGMETQSADDIATRLDAIAPKPGTTGYADAEEIFEKAQKHASDVLKERSRDPAAAVQKAFPDVKAMADQVDPQDPSTFQRLVAARLQAQTALGVTPFEQEPLTKEEVIQLARPVTAQPDPNLASKAMMDLAAHVEKTYGPQSDKVMTQVLSAQGVDKEMAQLGAGVFKKLIRGEKPSTTDKRQAQVLSETGAADGKRPSSFGLTGTGGDPSQPVASPSRSSASGGDFYGVPNALQQQRLLANPQLAPAFDDKFGPGAAMRIIGPRGPVSYQSANGRVTVAPDGTQTLEAPDQRR